MLKLNLLKILEEKGKSKYWLFIQFGMTYTNLNKIIMNETKSIKYETIDKLCKILDYEPNDLFTQTDDKNS